MKRKVIRTEADLLVHSYGKEPGAVEAPAAPPPAPGPEPAESEPPPESGSEAEELITKFVDKYNKDELVALADDNEIDSSGTKADIAARLVEAGWAPEE